ncbi:MAG: NIPSNAP family protein [Candidatus Eremiobacteraeota bacterium]|nr:NIPSNAP family protein [Candidatus Eremiobacteraeota bacterium]
MIVEQRTYALIPGKTAAYFELYAREGMQIQQQYLGKMLGYYSTDIGPVNEVVHMWGYEDHADRKARRDALQADPRWQAYVAQIVTLLVRQESRILVPAPFFSPRGAA